MEFKTYKAMEPSIAKQITLATHAARQYLVDKGIEGYIIGFVGFGSSKPIVNNSNKENRQKNRRVEISFMEGC